MFAKHAPTALWLNLAAICSLFLYLFGGSNLFGMWQVPVFDAANATAIIGTLGGLYGLRRGTESWRQTRVEEAKVKNGHGGGT